MQHPKCSSMDRPVSSSRLLQTIASWGRRNTFLPYALGYIVVKTVENKYVVDRLAKKTGLPTITNLDFTEIKNSDTLFILGTGSSVNRYECNQWKTIAKNDSAGVNYWAIHDFVPDFYSFELPKTEDHRNSLYHIFQAKSSEYKDTPFLLKDVPSHSSKIDINRLPDSIKANLYLSIDTRVPWNQEDLESLRRGYELLDKLGYFSQDDIGIVPYSCASIVYLTMLGLRMGYDDIVLCGVDLDNPEHFYTEESRHYVDRAIPVKKPEVKRTQHKTIDETAKLITVPEAIDILQATVLEKYDCNLHIGSTESALYPDLPYYFK